MKVLKIVVLFSLFIFPLFLGCEKEEEQKGIEVTIPDEVLSKIDEIRPKEIFVYETIPVKPELWMENLIKIIGVKGKVEENEDLIFVKDKDVYVEVRKISNASFFNNLSHLWMEEPTPEATRFNIPNNEECKKIALNWLKKFGFRDENIKNLVFNISDEEYELTLPDGGKTISVVTGKNIEIRRQLNGVTVYGPGSKIKLYIGDESKVHGFTTVWRKFENSSTVFGQKAIEGESRGSKEIPIDAREAFGMLKKNPLDHIPLALVYKIAINKAEFGYYSRSAVENQKYLQPVYVFSGTAYSKLPDGKEINVPYEQYVLALKKPVESIWPETKEFKPLERLKEEPGKQEEDHDEKGES